MAWWRTIYKQAGEAWQQLLYSLELAFSGGDDLPWLDTLNFTWDSLPDGEKLTTAERRRLAHNIKQRVRDSVSKHYAHELSHKAAIRRRQAAATAQLAERHLQKLADARQRQMEELCSQSRQSSMRLPSVAELEQIEGQWLLPQQGGGQPWPLLQQQQRASSSHFARRWQQQKQPARRVAVVNQAGQRVVRGVARSSSIASSSRLERVLSGDEAAENAAAEMASCSGDAVIHIPHGFSNSSSSTTEPVATQQQQQRAAELQGIVTGADSSTCELQQPLLPPVVESPFAAPQQQLQQQPASWDVEQQQQQQQQQQQDGQYQPPGVLVLAAAKLQQLQQQQQQQAPAVATALTSSGSGSGLWTFSFNHHPAAAGARLPIPGSASQLKKDPATRAAAGSQGCLQPSGSQMLLQRYLDGGEPAPHVVSAAAKAAAAGQVPLQLCAAEDAPQLQQGQQPCCGVTAESEPPSECATASSSQTADQYSSCFGGCQSESMYEVSHSPLAAGTAAVRGAAPAAAVAADVAAPCALSV